MKRFLSTVMILILLAVSALGEENRMRMAGYDGDNGNHDWKTNLFFQRMEERTGTGFEPEQFTDYQKWTQKKQDMLSGTDLPDVLFKAELTDNEIQDLYNAGILIDLRPYIEKYAPNLNTMLQQHPDWEKAITLPDGAIATLPCLNPLQNNNAMWINQSWLKNLGLEMPATANELTEVLTAFKTGDPNGNGKADEIPLSFIGMWDLRFLAHAYGIVTNDYYVCMDENGEVSCPLNTDEYREFILWLNELWNADLLWHQGFSSTDSMRQITDEKVVMTYGMFLTPSPIMLVPNNALNQYVLLNPLEYDGKKVYRNLLGDTVKGAFAVTSACREPEKAVAWADQLYSAEGSMMALYGLEGNEYVWNEDGYWMWNDTTENVVNNILPNATIGEGGVVPGYIDPEFQLKYADEDTRFNVEQLGKLKTYTVLPVPQMIIPGETAEKINALQAEIGPYAETMLAAFVCGDIELNDQNWDTFVNGLEERGINEMTGLWQTLANNYGGQ